MIRDEHVHVRGRTRLRRIGKIVLSSVHFHIEAPPRADVVRAPDPTLPDPGLAHSLHWQPARGADGAALAGPRARSLRAADGGVLTADSFF